MSKNKIGKQKNLKIPTIIIVTAKVLSFFSTKLVTRFAAKLFVTPIQHKTPKRELNMDANAEKQFLNIPSIQQDIMTYHYGNSEKKILLVHGWSGRGTQMFKIADELLKNNYATVSFDAPAHGKSTGKSAVMTDFIDSILEVDKQFGPFEAIIGHSLGGMSTLNAIKKGLKVNKAVIIGSGDIVHDILKDFILKLKIKPETSSHLKMYFEKKYKVIMDDFSAYKAASQIDLPVLVIHDNHDTEVPVSAGIHIHKHCKNGKLQLTDNLGHRKILGDKEVIDSVLMFLQKN